MPYPFQVGNLRCIALNDQYKPMTLEGAWDIFSSVPRQAIQTAFENQGDDERAFCYNPLYIATHHVLIDAGLGETADRGNQTVNELAQVGISPQEVRTVLISHAHGDHINGLGDANGARVYPNARYFIGKREWEYWMGKEADAHYPAEQMADRRRRLRIIEGDVTFIEPGDEIVPGVTAIEAYGHTVGQLAVLLESAGEKLLHLADSAHVLMQLTHPDWSPQFDRLPELSPVTRRRLFQLASDEQMKVYVYHFPFPPLGYIQAQDETFVWQTI